MRCEIGWGFLPAKLVITTNPGKIFRFAAEPISDPASHAGSTTQRGTGIHHRMSRVVVNLVGDHRTNDGDVVGQFAMPRQKVTDPLAALTILTELRQMPLNSQLLSLQLLIGWPIVKDSGIGLPSSSFNRGL